MLRALEEQLIVDLEDQLGLQLLACEGRVGAHHRDLHDVRGGALDDHVHGEPLPLLAQLPAACAQLRHLPAAAEERRDVAVLGPLLNRVRDEALDGGEAGEVALDEVVGLALRDVEAVSHPVGGEPVDNPVVDHLRLGTHPGVNLVRGHVEDAHRRGGVHVLPAFKDLLEHVLTGDLRQQPQLHLRVIGADQQVARLRDEAGADLPSERGPDRDVLQVRAVR